MEKMEVRLLFRDRLTGREADRSFCIPIGITPDSIMLEKSDGKTLGVDIERILCSQNKKIIVALSDYFVEQKISIEDILACGFTELPPLSSEEVADENKKVSGGHFVPA
jgi:hypothetical protein